VRGVSFEVRRGETLGIVGESGCGKSVTMRAVMGLIEPPGRIAGGDVRWHVGDADGGAKGLVGDRVTMVFQDAGASLNPLIPVGRQITEILRKHRGMTRKQAETRALELLDLVGIPSPKQRFGQYPFEFSGGMAQRAAITLALAPEPDLIIADEPTTALDVTIQAQILELIRSLQAQFHMAVVLIAHDLGVVAGMCDRVAVMYAGRIVEEGGAHEIFRRPRHPYTAGLIASTPRLDRARHGRLPSIPGMVPGAGAAMPACAFAPRCARATDRCRAERPELAPDAPGHVFACWHPLDVQLTPAPAEVPGA
jgi:oligopeptide/dipeptide ABC transporter ATP-binding protein